MKDYYGYPNCTKCIASEHCSGRGMCTDSPKGCNCTDGYTGNRCDVCANGRSNYPTCSSIFSLTPVSGLFSVSTELVFTGENFINTTNVLVGSKNCVVKDKNETHLVCTSQPQDTYGAYVVNVTTTLGTVTAPVHGFFAYGLERRASIFGTMTNMATEDGIVTGGLILSINLVQDMFTRALQTGSALAESFCRSVLNSVTNAVYRSTVFSNRMIFSRVSDNRVDIFFSAVTEFDILASELVTVTINKEYILGPGSLTAGSFVIGDSSEPKPFISSVSPSSATVNTPTAIFVSGNFLGKNKADVIFFSISGYDCLPGFEYLGPSALKCTVNGVSGPFSKGSVQITTSSGGQATTTTPPVTFSFTSPLETDVLFSGITTGSFLCQWTIPQNASSWISTFSVFLNGKLQSSVSSPSTTISSLEHDTVYSVYVVAHTSSGQASLPSAIFYVRTRKKAHILTFSIFELDEDSISKKFSMFTEKIPDFSVFSLVCVSIPAFLFSTPPNINPASGYLELTPAPNAHGSSNCTLSTPSNPNQDPSFFSIKVRPVNDAPSISVSNSSQITYETPLSFTVFVPWKNANQLITLPLLTSPGPLESPLEDNTTIIMTRVSPLSDVERLLTNLSLKEPATLSVSTNTQTGSVFFSLKSRDSEGLVSAQSVLMRVVVYSDPSNKDTDPECVSGPECDANGKYISTGTCSLTCIGNKWCNDGVCRCKKGWTGEECNVRDLLITTDKLPVTSEDGDNFNILFTFGYIPTGRVSVSISSSDPKETSVSPSILSISSYDVESKKVFSVNVKGKENRRDGGVLHWIIFSSINAPLDASIHGRTIPSIRVFNKDKRPQVSSISPKIASRFKNSTTIRARISEIDINPLTNLPDTIFLIDGVQITSVNFTEVSQPSLHILQDQSRVFDVVMFNVTAPPEERYAILTAKSVLSDTTTELKESIYFASTCTEPGLWESNQGTCESCPEEGAECPGGKRMWPLKGWWNKGEKSLFVSKCKFPDACIGGKESACAEGYTGTLCGSCAPGWKSLPDGSCGKCEDNRSAVFTAIAVTNSVLLVLFLIMLHQFPSELLSLAMPFIFTLQDLYAVGQQSPPGLPSYILNIYSVLGLFAFKLDNFEFGCAAPNIPFFTLTFSLTTGFVVCMLILGPGLIYLFGVAGIYDKKLSVHRAKRGVIFTISVFYMNLCELGFRSINCIIIVDGNHVLPDDPSIICGDPALHLPVMFPGILVILFVVAFPVLLFWWLWKHRDVLQSDESIQKDYGFIYDAFKETRSMFWIGEISMAMVLASMYVFLQERRTIGSIVVIVAVAAYISLIVVMRPFKSLIEANVVCATMLIPVIGALGNILIREEIGKKETVVDFYQYSMVTMLVFFVVAYLVMFSKFAIKMWRKKFGKRVQVEGAYVTSNIDPGKELDVEMTDITVNGVKVESWTVEKEMPYERRGNHELTIQGVVLPNLKCVLNGEPLDNVKWSITCELPKKETDATVYPIV